MDRQVVSLVLGRLGLALVTILIVSFVVFAATAMLPGDVAQILLGQAATDEAVAGLRTAMHSTTRRSCASCAGSPGCFRAISAPPTPTTCPSPSSSARRLANTLKLAAVTAMVAVPVALFLGITTAMYRGRLYDRVVHARRRHHLGAGVHDRDPRRAGLRGLAALAAGALLRQRRHRPSTCSAPTPCRSSRSPSSSRRR